MQISAFRCVSCGIGQLSASGDELRCGGCVATYAVTLNTVDFIGEPDEAVARELEGLAAENGVDLQEDGFDAVKFLRVGEIESTADLMASSRHESVQYYQHTTAAWFEALARIQPDAGMRVLEIGSERTHFNLRVIEDLCEEAFALNIFFHITPRNETQTWPTRVLGDMNSLPFADGYFDLVVASATMHHSASPGRALTEIARVLRPGGRAVVINEPVEGSLKARGRRDEARHDRDEHIHEDPVSMKQWRTAISASGLRAEHFLPIWYMQQVSKANTSNADRRFAWLARILSPFVRRAGVQDLARLLGRVPAQYSLGLPLNVVLWKDAV